MKYHECGTGLLLGIDTCLILYASCKESFLEKQNIDCKPAHLKMYATFRDVWFYMLFVKTGVFFYQKHSMFVVNLY